MSDFSELNKLVEAIESESTRVEALRHLHAIADHLETRVPIAGISKSSKSGEKAKIASDPLAQMLNLKVIAIPGSPLPLKLLLHTAVFSPEEWAKTFAEGLLKNPDLFRGKTLVELGTGSGWISLLLLMRTQATAILGLDINPIAVSIAKLNSWLNGTTRDGEVINSQFGLPFAQAFFARESDLLGEPLSRKAKFDHIIGCIPQVLHPDPRKGHDESGERSHQDLYDLSNYCFQQGILEDRFGLPLIARALEEAQLCLNPGGRLTLVLGGRPGPQAIDQMFRRRGWEPTLIWSRRIQQADDTDLVSLVEIERTHQIRFNFFLSRDSQNAVTAETAVTVLGKDQPIYHDLLVYQAQTRYESPTFGFVRNLHDLGLDRMRKELDFSRISEEMVSFLNRFSSELLTHRTLPYPHECGDMGLRKALSRFLSNYCHYPTKPEALFVGPERSQLLALVLKAILPPNSSVLLSSSVESVYRSTLEKLGLKVILGNDDLSELNTLDQLLSPSACILAPQQLANPSSLTLDHLFAQARLNPNRFYIIDDSAQFNIGSELNSNMTLRMAGRQRLPENLIFLYGLIKNTVFPDFELSFLVNAPESWMPALEVGAELTYSRIPYQVQLYYQWLFEELLAFPFPEADVPPALNTSAGGVLPLINEIASDPVFAPKPISLEDQKLIRFDYGEVEHPVPELLIKGVFKGFLEQDSELLPSVVRHRVKAYLEATRRTQVNQDQIVLGKGVFPVLAALMAALTQRLGRAPIVALPVGSYGPLYTLVTYHGGKAIEVKTDAKRGFMVDVAAIDALEVKPDLIWLTQPNNPSGLFYDSQAVESLYKTCSQRGIYMLADEIFFLLSDNRLGEWTPQSLSFLPLTKTDGGKHLFLADGVAKSFAAGGLRAGFLVCPDAGFASQIQAITPLPPRSTLRAWDTLYSAFLEESPHLLVDVKEELDGLKNYLVDLRSELSRRRKKLLTLFKEHDVDDKMDTPYRGGIFLMAKLGEFRRQLAEERQLLINEDAWCRTPGWSRVSFSVPEDKFEEAFERLSAFLGSKSKVKS
jgi:aspartate/methionine/tyrosine aminotransferase/methylase of polypeptide subunit release factors